MNISEILAGIEPVVLDLQAKLVELQAQIEKVKSAAAGEVLPGETPVDTTPYSEEQMNEVKAKLEEAMAEAAAFKANDEADQATIAGLNAKLEAIKNLIG